MDFPFPTATQRQFQPEAEAPSVWGNIWDNLTGDPAKSMIWGGVIMELTLPACAAQYNAPFWVFVSAICLPFVISGIGVMFTKLG